MKSLCQSIRKSKAYQGSSKIGQAASNFLSLAKEREIVVDLAFYVDFNNVYFEPHFDFNRFTDKNIGSSGFILHHHLVRYFLKIQDLKLLEEELNTTLLDVVDGNLQPNHLLTKFWVKLCYKYQECTTDEERNGVARSLKRAQVFIHTFKTSLHKHNKHFV